MDVKIPRVQAKAMELSKKIQAMPQQEAQEYIMKMDDEEKKPLLD